MKLYFKISLTFLPQTVVFSPPFGSTRRHLVEIVAFASPSTPSVGLPRAEGVHMDFGLIFYNRVPVLEVASPKDASSLPCLRHRKRTCLIQRNSDTQVKNCA